MTKILVFPINNLGSKTDVQLIFKVFVTVNRFFFHERENISTSPFKKLYEYNAEMIMGDDK